jgi:hypothetical protein
LRGETPSVASRHLPPRGEKKPAVIIVGFVDHLGFFPPSGGNSKGGCGKKIKLSIYYRSDNQPITVKLIFSVKNCYIRCPGGMNSFFNLA